MSRPAAVAGGTAGAAGSAAAAGRPQWGLKALVAGLALACLLATAFVLRPRGPQAPALPSPAYLQAKGDAFFAASFKRFASGVQPLQPLRGQPVIAYFWASGCAACIDEAKALQALQDQHRARGLVVVGFGVDQADRIERFVRDNAIGFTVFAGGQAAIDLSKKLGNLREGMPFAVALDRQGRATLHHLGRFAPQTAQDLAAAALK